MYSFQATLKKEYSYMNQKTYIPVSILPFANSGTGRFFSKGQDSKCLRCCEPFVFCFYMKWVAGRIGSKAWGVTTLILTELLVSLGLCGLCFQETEVNNTSQFKSFSILLCTSKPVFTFDHILNASFSYHVENRVRTVQVKWHEIRNSSFTFPGIWISIAL